MDGRNDEFCGLLGEYDVVNGFCKCFPCVIRPPLCLTVKCENGGTRRGLFEVFSSKGRKACSCPPWFGGYCCEIGICSGGGTYLGNGTCICPAYSYGKHCEHLKCRNSGFYNVSTDMCSCTTDWAGPRCERKSCRNGGKWDEQNKRCICPNPRRFSGSRCDKLVCRRGRLEFDHLNQDYYCSCPLLYQGNICDELYLPTLGGLVAGLGALLLITLFCTYQCNKKPRPSTRHSLEDMPRSYRMAPVAGSLNRYVSEHNDTPDHLASFQVTTICGLSSPRHHCWEDPPPAYDEVVKLPTVPS